MPAIGYRFRSTQTHRRCASCCPARQVVLRCSYFTLEYVQIREAFTCVGEGRLQAFIVIRGRGHWQSPQGEEPLSLGHAWLLPATLPRITCHPEPLLGALLCTFP